MAYEVTFKIIKYKFTTAWSIKRQQMIAKPLLSEIHINQNDLFAAMYELSFL